MSLYFQDKPSCAILILNYNGKELLKRCLPSILQSAAATTVCKTRIIVVDNCSSDGSVQWLGSAFPAVEILPAPENDFLFSLNWAAARLTSNYLLLLNNDVICDRYAFDPLLEPLVTNPDVFSVTPLLLKPDNQGLDAAKRWGEFRRGFLHHETREDVKCLCPTLFPTGGAFSVKRHRFLELGGFRRLYYPAYWEDIDLGYRAWKAGFVNLFQHESKMYHIGSASWGKEKPERVHEMQVRNAWLFTWSNVTDRRIQTTNLYWTARYYIGAIKRHDDVTKRAYRSALARRKEVARFRRSDSRALPLTDREVCVSANKDWFPSSRSSEPK